MADPHADRTARVVVERMLTVRPGQRVLIEGPTTAVELVRRIARRVHGAGGVPSVRLVVDGLAHALVAGADAAVLGAPDRLGEHVVRRVDATVRVLGAWSTRELAGVDAARLAAATRGQGPVRNLRMRRAADEGMRWAVVLAPCEAFARAAGMEPDAYAALVHAAAKVDVDDPVGAWDAQERRQAALVERLVRTRTLRFVAEGTDVTVGVAGRRWRSSAANRNLPDGEVFTGPLEDSAQGVVRFTYPISRGGRRVEDVRLVFEAGRVVEASAGEGVDVLRAILDLDEGARRLGEVGIGTNDGLDRFTANTLLDEKIGGTFHLALGQGYPETGSTNTSAEHWDLVCDLRRGGAILADGEVIQSDGRWAAGVMP